MLQTMVGCEPPKKNAKEHFCGTPCMYVLKQDKP